MGVGSHADPSPTPDVAALASAWLAMRSVIGPAWRWALGPHSCAGCMAGLASELPGKHPGHITMLYALELWLVVRDPDTWQSNSVPCEQAVQEMKGTIRIGASPSKVIDRANMLLSESL